MNQMTFQRICAWSGVICVVLFFGAFALAGFIPPLSPSLSAEQVAAHYREHTTGSRIGMDLMLLSGAFYAMFTAVMSGQMRRIPGVSPTMVYTQLGAGSFACLTFLMPAIFFIVASFRPERAPEMTQILNDLAWIMMVIPWMPFMAQNFAFAFAILSDPRPQPLFPRWVGFLNIWAPISFTPSEIRDCAYHRFGRENMSKPDSRLGTLSVWALAFMALTSQAQEPVPAEASTPTTAEPIPEALDTIPVASTEPEDEPAETPEARRGFGVDEIIVTAQKREEAASTVPIAITAYSGEDMATWA